MNPSTDRPLTVEVRLDGALIARFCLWADAITFAAEASADRPHRRYDVYDLNTRLRFVYRRGTKVWPLPQ